MMVTFNQIFSKGISISVGSSGSGSISGSSSSGSGTISGCGSSSCSPW